MLIEIVLLYAHLEKRQAFPLDESRLVDNVLELVTQVVRTENQNPIWFSKMVIAKSSALIKKVCNPPVQTIPEKWYDILERNIATIMEKDILFLGVWESPAGEGEEPMYQDVAIRICIRKE